MFLLDLYLGVELQYQRVGTVQFSQILLRFHILVTVDTSPAVEVEQHLSICNFSVSNFIHLSL